jgi:hypothetical protein
VEVADEYLYSSENDQITGDEKVNKLRQFPNPTSRRNDRKKRPVSRQDSNLYDLADPTSELGPSRAPENVPTPSSTSQKITIKCNKRCIFVSILCVIVVIGLGAGTLYVYKDGIFESTHKSDSGKNKCGSFEIDLGLISKFFLCLVTYHL